MHPTNHPIRYETSTASRDEILGHLQACSAQFRPPLNDRVDVPTYANKLFQRSITFEAWHGNDLIGLVAAYLNLDTQSRSAFVSNVSVLETFHSQGVGRRLMTLCHRTAKSSHVSTVTLEVSVDSTAAVALYSRLGYSKVEDAIEKTDGDTVLMQLNLENE